MFKTRLLSGILLVVIALDHSDHRRKCTVCDSVSDQYDRSL